MYVVYGVYQQCAVKLLRHNGMESHAMYWMNLLHTSVCAIYLVICILRLTCTVDSFTTPAVIALTISDGCMGISSFITLITNCGRCSLVAPVLLPDYAILWNG